MTKNDAADVARLTEMEGWKRLVEWIEGRKKVLVAQIENGDADISVEDVRTASKKAGDRTVEVTILNVVRDPMKQELRFWGMFFSKIRECEQMAKED